MAQRAVGVLFDVDESEGGGGFGELLDIGLGAGGDLTAVLHPGLAHVEVAAVFRLRFVDLGKILGPGDIEIIFRELGIGVLGGFRVEEDVRRGSRSRRA